MSRAKPYTNDIYNAGWLPYANDIYNSADGEYNVSIIHINCSHTAISIVEPQDDADTFINSCGETGERPAIRVMSCIKEAKAIINLNDKSANKLLTIQVTYDGVCSGVEVHDILLELVKPKINDIKADAVSDVLCGLSRFVANNGIMNKPFDEIIKLATDCAKTRGVTVGKLLNEYANM